MSIVFLIIYLFLLAINFISSFRKKQNVLLVFITFAFIVAIICGHKYIGNGDNLDLYYYERDYAKIKFGSKDFFTYYLFYFSQILCQKIGLSYFQWWFIMSSLAIILIAIASFKFKYNTHLIIAFFMFYIVALISGLKYFYGLCIFIFAVSFLIRGKKKDIALFIIFTMIAGGFHALYYLFFVLLFSKIRIKTLYSLFVFSAFLFVLIFLFRDIFRNILSSFFILLLSSINSTKGSFFMDETRFGVLIPIFLHLATLFYSFYIYKLSYKTGSEHLYSKMENILKVNLVCIVFYPLFLFAINYSRLLTIISFITICVSSYEFYKSSRKFKQNLYLISIPVIVAFGFYFFFVCDYFNSNFLHMFDLYFFRGLL